MNHLPLKAFKLSSWTNIIEIEDLWQTLNHYHMTCNKTCGWEWCLFWHQILTNLVILQTSLNSYFAIKMEIFGHKLKQAKLWTMKSRDLLLEKEFSGEAKIFYVTDDLFCHVLLQTICLFTNQLHYLLSRTEPQSLFSLRNSSMCHIW